MRRFVFSAGLLFLFCESAMAENAASFNAARGSSAVLAPDFQVVASSPDPEHIFLGSPAIAKLPSGRYVVTYDLFGHDAHGCVVLTSDDDCQTWQTRATVDLTWASPFVLGDHLYLLGSRLPTREIAIARSADNGRTWSPPVTLFEGSFRGACVSVIFHNGRVYRAFEGQAPPPDEISSGWTSLVVAGDLAGDLLDPASWRISNAVSYPGTPKSLTQGLHVHDARIKKGKEGWLEGNVLEKDGRLLVLLRTRMQAQTTANMTSVCEVTDDGKQLSNRFLQFYPLPGGQNKFHILRDPQTGIYWAATTQVSDSFQHVDPLLKIGFKGTGGNERRIQVLMYSADAWNWFQAGFVAFTPKLLECFSYGWLMIDGDDLIVLCRSSLGGRNNHDSNKITLHRIERFRELVPKDLFRPIPRVHWNTQ